MSTGVIIGATGGIGSACASALARDADRIVLSGRRQEALAHVAASVGEHATAVVADLATPGGRDAITEAVADQLNWLVLASGMPLRSPLKELADEDIEAAYLANLVGPTLLLRRLLQLDWHPPASIVLIGSISASRSLPRRAVYGATKAGVEHLARSLAAELAPVGIRVNIVAPGVVETPFLGEDAEALDDWVRTRIPAARLGRPDEVANTVRFLITDAPQYLTGARITVDGGAEAIA